MIPQQPDGIDHQRLSELENRLIQVQIDNLTRQHADHETRMRLLEESATKFNFLLYLTFGGGLLSLINLLALLWIIVQGAQQHS